MDQQIRFCTTSDGVRIAYAVTGEGPPLVLVRGWVSHLELDVQNPAFQASMDALTPHFQVIRYDKRGTGLSDRDASDFSPAARLRDLEAVVDAVKLRRFALQGFSEGGPIAIAYAARYPKRVSRLVLMGTYARGAGLARPDVRDALLKLVQAEWGLGSETLTNIFIPGASKEEHDRFVAYQRAAARRADAAAMLQANYDVDVSALLPRVKAPTLIVHAKGDRAIPFEQGRELAGVIPNARFLPIESDRHVPDEETSAQISQAILAFLREGEETKKDDAPAASPSGLVTILFTDIESSSALRQQLGDAKAQELVRTHNTIVRQALKSHAGSEIKHTGDGIMASFPSAIGALDCAVAIQRGVAGYLAANPDAPLGVYVGLNAGEPIAEERDLFGTSVDLARRLCDQAAPGEILVSNVVRELASGKEFLFSDRGAAPLKGFDDPVRLYEVRWREEK